MRRARTRKTNHVKVVIVTGTPGTGKTTLAKRLAKALSFLYIDVKQVIKEDQLQSGYDRKRKVIIVDETKLARSISKRIRVATRGMVIDSHLSQYLSPSLADACLVTVCDLKTLARRLKKKGYAAAKIKENIQAEIFDTCAQEARELGHEPIVVDTTDGTPLARVIRSLNRKGINKQEKIMKKKIV